MLANFHPSSESVKLRLRPSKVETWFQKRDSSQVIHHSLNTFFALYTIFVLVTEKPVSDAAKDYFRLNVDMERYGSKLAMMTTMKFQFS